MAIGLKSDKYQSPGVGITTAGITTGLVTTGSVVNIPHGFFSRNIIQKMNKINESLSANEFSQIEKAIAESMTKTNLASKGVGILKASSENTSEIMNIMTAEFDKGILKFLPKKVKESLGKMYASMVNSGSNAFYAMKTKKIVLPEKGLNLAAFHEIGHAMNANLSVVGKTLQKMRGAVILSIPILLISLFKNKKPDGEKPHGWWDKTTTFIKENSGKLTFASFVPLLAEEALATIKGNKLAKELLNNPGLTKKIARTNFLGFSTYFGFAALFALGTFLGTKVKDKITTPKLVKNTNNQTV